VTSDEAGKCSICGMNLEPVGETGKMKEGDAGMKERSHEEMVTGAYVCPMHPEVTSDEAGKCSICGMHLVPADEIENESQGEESPGEKSSRSGTGDGHMEHTRHAETSGSERSRDAAGGEQVEGEELYHCPMHPTYVADSPGECPICGMDLVPVEKAADEASDVEGRAVVKVDPTRQQLIGVETDTARVVGLEKTIETVGRVAYDETKVVMVHPRVKGWIEDIFVDYTGKAVKRGEPLFSIYSPELYTTQEEYFIAREGEEILGDGVLSTAGEDARSLSAAARKRLELFDITDRQIEELEKNGRPGAGLRITSPIDGYVIEKSVYDGRFVKPDESLYTIADLSKLWVLADVYEYELPAVKLGQEALVRLSYLPGVEFRGRVSYIYPYLDSMTRTATLRIEVENPDRILKPDMYAEVMIEVDLGLRLVVPRDALMDTGNRQIAYVKTDERRFEPRDVTTGVTADGRVEVLGGISPGEVVVTSANFLIDSESRLRSAVMSMAAGSGAGGHEGH
jgi:multidrug efflux pump subunit AcrA (membrane-fusion protein)